MLSMLLIPGSYLVCRLLLEDVRRTSGVAYDTGTEFDALAFAGCFAAPSLVAGFIAENQRRFTHRFSYSLTLGMLGFTTTVGLMEFTVSIMLRDSYSWALPAVLLWVIAPAFAAGRWMASAKSRRWGISLLLIAYAWMLSGMWLVFYPVERDFVRYWGH
jgi:hypothetical protein